jgi:hypothetical protein
MLSTRKHLKFGTFPHLPEQLRKIKQESKNRAERGFLILL